MSLTLLRPRRLASLAASALATVVVATAAHGGTPLPPWRQGGAATSAAASGPAAAALAALPVRDAGSRSGYRRSLFGPTWADTDRNGCDTRNDILRRDLRDTRTSGRCRVLSGTLHDPYTGRTIAFRRGATTSLAVQIDHVVALADAWRTGARQLDPGARALLANDPLNLLAVDGPTNETKGDSDAAGWLPPNRAYRCAYAARQVAVKARHGLWVTPTEHDALSATLARCPGQQLPTS